MENTKTLAQKTVETIKSGRIVTHPVGGPGHVVARGVAHYGEHQIPALIASHYIDDWYIVFSEVLVDPNIMPSKHTEGRWCDWVSFAKDILRAEEARKKGLDPEECNKIEWEGFVGSVDDINKNFGPPDGYGIKKAEK